MKLFLFLGSFCVFKPLVESTQHLYKFTPEHCELKNINKSLIHINVAKCYKISRNELFFNASFYFKNNILTDDVGQVLITGYQFRSNEYRKGPIEFMLGLCTGLTSTDFDVPHMFSHSNMRCPFIKGREYHVYNLSPNATNMPPFIPEGRWMLQLDFMYMNKYIIASLQWYSGVEYPIIFG